MPSTAEGTLFHASTLESSVTVHGHGLHDGRPVTLTLRPGPVGEGVVFVRADLPGAPRIPAHVDHVQATQLATTLGAHGASVSTVEHLLAALSALGVDDVEVSLDGPEVPILDGSAARWVEHIRRAGLVAEARRRRVLVVEQAVTVREGDRWARLEPAPALELVAFVDFDHPAVPPQSRRYVASPEAFVRELAGARTFGFARDVAAMRARGLALGGSLDNAVLVDDHGVANPEGLRFPDELVRHKLLDAIGDLALLGLPLVGRYVGHKSGHLLNTRLARAVWATPGAASVHALGRGAPRAASREARRSTG